VVLSFVVEMRRDIHMALPRLVLPRHSIGQHQRGQHPTVDYLWSYESNLGSEGQLVDDTEVPIQYVKL